MTDIDLMTPLQLTVMAWLSAGLWSYLFARWLVRTAREWQRERRAARYRATYRHPAGRGLVVDILNGSKHN